MTSKGLCITVRCANVAEFVSRFHPFCDETSLFIATPAGAREIGVESRFAILLADTTPVLRGSCVVLESWADQANPFGRPGIRIGVSGLTPSSQEVFDQLQAARAAAIAASEPIKCVAVAREPTAPTVLVVPPRRAPTVPSGPVVRASTVLGTPPMRAPVRSRRTISIPVLTSPHPDPRPHATSPATTTGLQVDMASLIPPQVASTASTPLKLADGSAGFSRPPRLQGMRPAPGSFSAPLIVAEGTETRTLGSATVLPANPLMNLTDASLEAFVDCRLHDQIGNFFDDSEAPLDEVPAAPATSPEPTQVALVSEARPRDRAQVEWVATPAPAVAADAARDSAPIVSVPARAEEVAQLAPTTDPDSMALADPAVSWRYLLAIGLLALAGAFVISYAIAGLI